MHDASPSIPSAAAPERTLRVSSPKSSTRRAAWQLTNSLGPYAALWCTMAWVAQHHWSLVLPLAVLAAGFLVRLFIIFHDCGHGSFLNSRRANAVVGFITGTLTFAPHYHWWGQHARHHASSGDLDRRGVGDIWTLTVREYLEASRLRRFAYRLARNPVILFVIAPLFEFVVHQRFAARNANRRERLSVHVTNLAILGMAVGLSFAMGLGTFLLIQLLVMGIAGAAGVWLFYVQHQFEHTYWERREHWDPAEAALQGSSYYQLPRILQWFSGNIGFHHVHHLNPRVPNYYLERVHRSHPRLSQVKPLTLRASLRSLRLRLWDESAKQLVGYPRRGPADSPA